ncbi:methylisocitrate lyase domain protein [Mycobacterium xenopi 4042]|uniref:Methylisocitrate lyase domain protein n=1 Tax=Mycobacterium xenopi 4042 TaxID=1299334 RepID=X8ANZ7_MYCXE|nr:methylisocitrate lyase domain protein [Mycobacterium xenopi 4042]
MSAADKRARFRAALESGRLQRFPGASSPLVAKLIAALGFDGVYVSGAGAFGRFGPARHRVDHPDRSVRAGAQIATLTARTVTVLEDAGLAAATSRTKSTRSTAATSTTSPWCPPATW